jgi:hypothetical protein
MMDEIDRNVSEIRRDTESVKRFGSSALPVLYLQPMPRAMRTDPASIKTPRLLGVDDLVEPSRSNLWDDPHRVS